MGIVNDYIKPPLIPPYKGGQKAAPFCKGRKKNVVFQWDFQLDTSPTYLCQVSEYSVCLSLIQLISMKKQKSKSKKREMKNEV